jgi:predicted RNase H-like HicB family nuclease
MRHYIAVMHKDADTDYGISFPDFPGAVTAAASIDDAIEMAEEALALHVEGMLEDGEDIPEPSGIDAIKASADYRDAPLVFVPLRTDALAMRVNVTLPAKILRRIDTYVEEAGLTRSGFLADAAQHELARAARAVAKDVAQQLRRASKGSKPSKVGLGFMMPLVKHRAGKGAEGRTGLLIGKKSRKVVRHKRAATSREKQGKRR